MSSAAVRGLVRAFLENNSDEDIVDLTAEYEDLRGFLNLSGISPDAPWVGLEFVGDIEEPVSLTANNEKGLYREYGLIQLHVCAAARIGVGAGIETRAEVLRSLFRGRRIGALVVETVSPVNTGPGATLEFDGGYVSGTITVTYHYDFTPGV